ncbi:MAG: hypothetical protein JWL63_779 [Rhodocyclales bacterium]|nr:hypothetical protein [Rhodocyclales bacterium]
MNSNILKSVVAITLLGASLVASAQNEPGVANKVGTKIDNAAGVTKDAAIGAGHDVKEAAKAVGHKTKNAAETVGHETKEGATKAKNKVKHAVKRHPAADSGANSSMPAN